MIQKRSERDEIILQIFFLKKSAFQNEIYYGIMPFNTYLTYQKN